MGPSERHVIRHHALVALLVMTLSSLCAANKKIDHVSNSGNMNQENYSE